ncbi:MAG: hypothetical protein ACO1PB_19625, partial [Ramlibacter sp.]
MADKPLLHRHHGIANRRQLCGQFAAAHVPFGLDAKCVRQFFRADRRETGHAGHLAGIGANAIDLIDRQSRVVERFLHGVDRQQQRMARQPHANFR